MPKFVPIGDHYFRIDSIDVVEFLSGLNVVYVWRKGADQPIQVPISSTTFEATRSIVCLALNLK